MAKYRWKTPLPWSTMAEPNEAQVKLLTDGMQNFVGVLGTVCSVLGETRH